MDDRRARRHAGGHAAVAGSADDPRASARTLVVLLAASGGVALDAIASRVGLEASRAEISDVHADVTRAEPGARLAPVAELVHRLERGLRLM